MKRLLVAALVLASCAAVYAAYPMKLKDARGKSVNIKAKPMRVVSLTPSNTEILYAVGMRGRIAGVTNYCDYPEYVKSKPKIGDMTVNVEAVLSLKPDLVLAHAYMNDDVIPKLEKLGLTVYAINPKTIGDVIRDIRTIGVITARPKTAAGVADRMNRQIAAVKASRKGKTARRVLVVIQSNPLWVAGPRTFVDEMLKIANAKNVAYDARPGFNTYSTELAVSRNPEVIVVGLQSDVDYFIKSPAWKNTSAVKNKRVYVISSDLLVRPGPRLADGLKKLSEKVSF